MTTHVHKPAVCRFGSHGRCLPKLSLRLAAGLLCCLTFVATGLAPFDSAAAQRRDATYLLPENTVGFLRIEDTQQLLKRVRGMATFRMLRDPEIEPFVNSLYQSATEAVAGMQKDLGLTLDELQAIPLGEFCFAIVAPEKGAPATITLVQVKDRQDDARKVVKLWRDRLWESGRKISTEKVGETQLTVLTDPDSPNTVTVLFEFDDMIATTSNLELATGLLSAIEQDDVSRLADNTSFATIMSHCEGTADERPQVTYFVDPMRLIHSVTSTNAVLQMSVAILGRLGLDGLRGVGGSLLVGGEAFESVHHTHILTDTPREGVLQIISPRTGDVSPEEWVPNDAATYMTLHWDLVRAYSAYVRAYEQFRGPETWGATVVPAFRNRYGVDLERDLLQALDGRVTRVTWTNDKELVSRAATMLCLRLKDHGRFRSTLQKMASHSRQSFERRSTEGIAYYRFTPSPATRAGDPVARAFADSYVGILGDYLLLADNELLLQRAIETKRRVTPSLGEELDFKLNASKIRRLSRGTQPSMISFSRPEFGLRATYDALRSEESRERLGKLAEKNKVLGAIYRALSEHPLPPFHVIAKYFAFSGRLVTSDETGLHSVGFTFRRE